MSDVEKSANTWRTLGIGGAAIIGIVVAGRLLMPTPDPPAGNAQASQSEQASQTARATAVNEPKPNSDLIFSVNGKPARIQDVGLGDTPSTCSKFGRRPIRTEVGASMYGATGIMNICSIETSSLDKTTVYFDADQSFVISVRRTLFIGSDTNINALFQYAESFFGPPDQKISRKGYFLGYGSSFSAREDGTRITVEGLQSGRGLTIVSTACLWTDCPGNADYKVEFELVDQEAFAAAVQEGKNALRDRKQQRSRDQKF